MDRLEIFVQGLGKPSLETKKNEGENYYQGSLGHQVIPGDRQQY